MKNVIVLSFFVFLTFLTSAFAQLTENEVSEGCMNQIVAGMVDDKILGDEGGICVRFIKDANGSITGMDFKIKSTAFELGKDSLTDEEQKQRIKTVKDFVLNYQKLATKKQNLKIDDMDIQVRSYADGVGGPKTYDQEIKKMKTWSDILPELSDDKASLRYLSQVAPQSKNLKNEVNFDSLPDSAKSIIRNVVLGKKRSEAICKEFGISRCEKLKNSGFASPELEKRPNKIQRECADRRVSVIKVNLAKSAQIIEKAQGEFHPSFEIPESEEMKNDMQLASAFEAIKRQNDTLKKYSDPKVKEDLKNQITTKMKSTSEQSERFRLNQKLLSLNELETKGYGLMFLPDEAQNSSDYRSYMAMSRSFKVHYDKFKDKISAKYPKLLPYLEKGDFLGFKNETSKFQSKADIEQLKELESEFISSDTSPSTDFFNHFSSAKALQHHLVKNPNSSHFTNAASVVNQSNSELSIKLDSQDLGALSHSSKDQKAHWQCYGGCESGIHENENGEFKTTFRDDILKSKPKSSQEIEKEFGSNPLGFGSLKSLNVFVVKNCANCDCLKNPNIPMDEVLKGDNVTKVSIDKVTKNADGTRSFSKSVGKIEDPFGTCIFTPPVAHTCRVDPLGKNKAHSKGPVNAQNFACAIWDKSSHGLKWTTNFVQEGLGLVQNGTSDICSQKITSLKEKAAGAICEISDPPEVPQSCQ